MSRKIGVAEVKRHFSAVVSEVSLNKEHFIIEKKGRPMAAMVSVEELELIESLKKNNVGKGLLAALGAWGDFDDLEEMVLNIYDERNKSKDRNVEDLA
ncbi:MAG: hypothetical protein C0399_10000 [Syntrophus sp. (in: bacteria)]|nr:hypothetical protein [Syntrophus sp. (in: bacteria)]MBA4418578.1 hypothetical protein [Syntrophus sp. (in: bacteria)]